MSPPTPVHAATPTWRALRLLAAESFQDALRSRLGLAVAACALFALLFVDRCTNLGAGGGFVMNGQPVDPEVLSRALGPLLFGGVSLFLVAASGLVASDGLARPLADGSIALWLARPVSRATYAIARLAGTVALAIVAGGSVLAAAAFLLHLRHGLPLPPAFFGALVFCGSAWIVSAFAMTLSLYAPRVVTLFAVIVWIQVVVMANTAHVLGASFGGWFGALERWGPPLGTALLYAVSGWVAFTPPPGEMALVMLRLGLWVVASAVLLVVCVRRIEIR